MFSEPQNALNLHTLDTHIINFQWFTTRLDKMKTIYMLVFRYACMLVIVMYTYGALQTPHKIHFFSVDTIN
jgi:hypothetical protein